MVEIGSLPVCVLHVRPTASAAVPLLLGAALTPFAVWIAMLQPFSGRRALVIAHAALIWWLAFVALEFGSSSAPCKLLFSALAHGGLALLPAAWLIFIARFTFGTSDAGRIIQDRLTVAIPLVVLVVALTSHWHGLFFAEGTRLADDGRTLKYERGPLYVVLGAFLYGCIAVAAWFVVQAVRAAPSTQRYHFALLLVLTLVPTLGNAAYSADLIHFAGYDPTPFLFAASMLIYAQILVMDRTFDISSNARQQIFDRMPIPVVVLSADRKVHSANLAARDLFGAIDDPAAAGDNEEMRDVMAALARLAERIPRDGSETVSAVPIGPRLFDATFDPIQPPLGPKDRYMGWSVMLDDVTSAHERERRLSRLVRETLAARHAAERDHLTGLLNRRSLRMRFETAAAAASDDGRSIYGALIDIDHFKSINDTYGHHTGDLALTRLAAALRAAFRSEDSMFRLGGEEFLVLFEGPDVAALESRLRDARSRLLTGKDDSPAEEMPDVRFSAGIATWPQDGETMETFLETADRRLYIAKDTGRDRIVTAG